MTEGTVKFVLNDGSVEFVPADDKELLVELVAQHTAKALTGAVSFLDDAKFVASSGRVFRLHEIRSVE